MKTKDELLTSSIIDINFLMDIAEQYYPKYHSDERILSVNDDLKAYEDYQDSTPEDFKSRDIECIDCRKELQCTECDEDYQMLVRENDALAGYLKETHNLTDEEISNICNK